jgi:hypothetical protein
MRTGVHLHPWRRLAEPRHSKDTRAGEVLAAGTHYVVPDFALVQDIGGGDIADQIRRAVWVRNIAFRR